MPSRGFRKAAVSPRPASVEALEAIRAENKDGLLVPEEVVEAARDEDSPLHSYIFGLSDSEAAHQHRLTLARTLIRKIKVILSDDPTESPVPRYLSLKKDRRREGGGYRQTTEILKDKELIAELEATAKRELEAWSERYKMLSSLVSDVLKAAGLPKKGTPKKNKKK